MSQFVGQHHAQFGFIQQFQQGGGEHQGGLFLTNGEGVDLIALADEQGRLREHIEVSQALP